MRSATEGVVVDDGAVDELRGVVSRRARQSG